MATSFKINAQKALKIQKQKERSVEKIEQQIAAAAKWQKSEANAKRIAQKMARIEKGEPVVTPVIETVPEVVEEIVEEVVKEAKKVKKKVKPAAKKTPTGSKAKK